MNQLREIADRLMSWWEENRDEVDKLSPEAKKGIEDIYIRSFVMENYFMKHVSAPLGAVGRKLGFEDSECVDVWLEHGTSEPYVHFMLRYPLLEQQKVDEGIFVTARGGYVEESSWT